ncbi:MAG: ABC transporter ATP-binding protein [Imperialibacter sp.]|uniref:ABC transporter ATP-binding protein n=1 Tax=Imperialibacter sp. TaxID=2038411 RepID=UPI0032EE69EC
MNILVTEHIHKSFGDFKALDDVSITIPENTIFGLLGPNGAGKTTLIRIITQILMADQGKVMFHGRPLELEDVHRIGYLPEERGLYKKMKVGEQLLYLAQLKGMSKAEASKKIKAWMEKFDIISWWGKNVEDLSKGMAQKVQFIATVLHEPSLIILDEPFSGFDPVNANLIRDEILEMKKKGITIIFSTHRMESVEELCDHIALINKSKKILEGPKKDIKETYKSNTFNVLHHGKVNGLPADFDTLSTEEVEGAIHSTIQIKSALGPNDLLKALISQVEVHEFVEKIPSMNEIFIQKVQEGGHE